ncbi:MAG: hypothetical protein UHN47_07050 [Lachnospiraceae bacterium]|nr:hypothetical protein [Lachnospiraceae bacterium]
MNVEVLKKFSEKIIIKVENRNQEKEMVHKCRILGHKLVLRDSTAYNSDKKPIFPIYYGFYTIGDKVQSWWDIDNSWMKKNKSIIICYKCFLENIKEELKEAEDLYENKKSK